MLDFILQAGNEDGTANRCDVPEPEEDFIVETSTDGGLSWVLHERWSADCCATAQVGNCTAQVGSCKKVSVSILLRYPTDDRDRIHRCLYEYESEIPCWTYVRPRMGLVVTIREREIYIAVSLLPLHHSGSCKTFAFAQRSSLLK